MKKSILLVSLAIVNWGAFAQHDHSTDAHDSKKEMSQMAPMFKDQKVTDAYAQYIDLKNALVASDAMKVADASAGLVLALQDVKNGTKLFNQAKVVAGAKNLEETRKMFAALSVEMLALVKANKLSMGAIYVEYCPMANGNAGASWLSNEAAIMNPYFGDKMLKCGSVKETIQ